MYKKNHVELKEYSNTMGCDIASLLNIVAISVNEKYAKKNIEREYAKIIHKCRDVSLLGKFEVKHILSDRDITMYDSLYQMLRREGFNFSEYRKFRHFHHDLAEFLINW